jgi:methionyl-tRNA formyltransferase
LRIVFMGTPEFAVPSLERLIASQHRVVAVYTQPDRPAGRGRSMVSPPVKAYAEPRGLTVVQPDSLKTSGVVAQLADYRPDVVVVAAFGQILPQAVLDIPPHGCINIHPSLLPRYRGASPVASAILSGEEFTGVTIMLQEAGLDTGPVLTRAAVSISPNDNTGSLTGKLSLISAHLLQEALGGWLRGEIVPQPQNEAEATYFLQLKKEAGQIDWKLSAVEIWRRVRAFNPWPVCYTTWRGKQLKIVEAAVIAEEGGHRVGLVVALSGHEAAVGVGTGEGILGVKKVQLEGKRVMTSAEFLRGQRDFIGAVLPD